MVDPGWYLIQNSVREVLVIEVPVVWMGQTSKTADTIILPTVAANNQPMPQTIGGANNRKFVLIEVGLGLVSGQVCA